MVDLQEITKEIEEKISGEIKKIDKICEQNSLKVLNAFRKNKISDVHFNSTSGYGYGDIGREAIEKVLSDILGAEDTLCRTQIVSGTHGLTVALFGILRPGDNVVSINGKPYDTLDKVIGISENKSSLKAHGINYEQIDLLGNEFDLEKIKERAKKGNVKLFIVQRSRGYSLRKSLYVSQIKEAIDTIKSVNKEAYVMVDNCYGEFVETEEPIAIGADIIVGSLIKNMGGGIAPNGAYISGKKELVELIAERLTVPGQGKEIGPTLGINKNILQGIYMAPLVVANALKTAVFASAMLEKLGYKASPQFDERRTDIVQIIEFGDSEKLIKFCQGIQMGSAIDSGAIPEPWDMPGYTSKVIMASGSFTQGSSIELSCDAPIREPYAAFLQGGLTYEYGKLGVLKAIENLER